MYLFKVAKLFAFFYEMLQFYCKVWLLSVVCLGVVGVEGVLRENDWSYIMRFRLDKVKVR